MALVALSEPHGRSLLWHTGAGGLGLYVARGASRHTAVLHADWGTALHRSLVIAVLGEVGGQEALHETLVTTVLLPGQRRSNLHTLCTRMSSTVATAVPAVCQRADVHPEPSLLLPLRAPLRWRHRLGRHVTPTGHLNLKTTELVSSPTHGLEGRTLRDPLNISGPRVIRRQAVLWVVCNVGLPSRRIQVTAEFRLLLGAAVARLKVKTHALLLFTAGGALTNERLRGVTGNAMAFLARRSAGELG